MENTENMENVENNDEAMQDVTDAPPSPHPPIKRKYLLGKTFLKVYHIFCRVACMLTLMIQCALMDYYLVDYNSPVWACWAIADLAVVALFIVTFFVSYRHLKKRQVFVMPAQLGELPLTYISWFFYSILLITKIILLYALPTSIALQLEEANFFGPNMLRTAISLSSIIIYLVILTSHDTGSRSPQNEFITAIVGSVYIDLLDTSQFTDVLRDEMKAVFGNSLQYPTLAIICFNFMLPTAALVILSKKHFGKVSVAIRYRVLFKVIYFILVNVPVFVIRLLIWHLQDQNISVFLMKNVIAIGLAIKDIHEFTEEVSDAVRDEFHLTVHDFDEYYREPAATFSKEQEAEEANAKTSFNIRRTTQN